MADTRSPAKAGDQTGSPGQLPPLPDFRRHREILDEAERLRAAGKLVAAQKTVEGVLAQVPPYFAAWSLLGRIFKDANNPLAAAGAFQRAALLDGSDGPTLLRLAEAYLALHAMDLAAATLRAAEALAPNDPDLHVAWGELHRHEQNFDVALADFEAAGRLAPDRLETALSIGELQMALGDYDAAFQTLSGALRRAKGKPAAAAMAGSILYALAAHPALVARIDLLKEADATERLAAKADRRTAATLAFIRGRALDAAGRHEEAWRALQLGNEIIWNETAGGEIAAVREREALGLRHATSFPVVPERPFDPKAPLAIFLVGPSRSGKSTLERMIAEAFPDVQKGYESAIAEECVGLAASRAGIPQLTQYQALPASAGRLFGDMLAQAIAHRSMGRRILTNTHPGNIHQVGGIVRSCRNAFVVFLRRNVEDNALRCYQRLYSSGNAYSYRLTECRQHLRWYSEMSDAWLSRLPGRSMAVDYEMLVTEPQRILDQLGRALGLSAGRASPPADDRGSAAPYSQWMGM